MAREPDACSAPYRVRFDEAGPDGLLRTSVLLRYAQDVAWHHSTSRGFDRAWYAERGLAWLVRDGGGRRRRADPGRLGAGRAPPRSSAGVASGPDAGTNSTTRLARSSPRSRSTGSCSTRAARRPGSRPSSSPSSGRATATVRAGARGPRRSASRDARQLDDHGPSARARPDGPRQQRGLRRLARGGGDRGR